MSDDTEKLATSIQDGMSATFGLSDQAEMIADGLVDAGWIGPEAARQAKTDLENAREAGAVYRDRAHAAEQILGEADAEIERLKATIARVEDLAADLIRAGGTVNGQFIRARLRNAP